MGRVRCPVNGRKRTNGVCRFQRKRSGRTQDLMIGFLLLLLLRCLQLLFRSLRRLVHRMMNRVWEPEKWQMLPKSCIHRRRKSFYRETRAITWFAECQQQTEEPLLNLGCGCRGDIAKAHQSCIGIWFRTRGSNKCEICQQVATNIPSPDSLKSSSYWIWRADPASGSSLIWRVQRGCCSPIWLAFSILVGGLFLDVLLSVSLGVSALPVNIIVGILILLGLGTAFRLALECCHEWSSGRNSHMTDTTLNPGYPPTV